MGLMGDNTSWRVLIFQIDYQYPKEAIIPMSLGRSIPADNLFRTRDLLPKRFAPKNIFTCTSDSLNKTAIIRSRQNFNIQRQELRSLDTELARVIE